MPLPDDSPRAKLLDRVKALIMGDRNAQYGPPTQDFQRTADILNALGYTGPGGRKMLKHDTAVILLAVKMSRMVWTPGKQDTWDDTAGYAACGWECVEEELEAGEIE